MKGNVCVVFVLPPILVFRWCSRLQLETFYEEEGGLRWRIDSPVAYGRHANRVNGVGLRNTSAHSPSPVFLEYVLESLGGMCRG